MKLTAMAYAYPFIMKGIIKKQLKKYYDKAKLKNIITKTTREYKKIVKNSPYMSDGELQSGATAN